MLDEARELVYAANLAYRATSGAINAVPLLRRSLVLSLSALGTLPGSRLPIDDHLSADGARRVAGAIERYVRERNLLVGHRSRR